MNFELKREKRGFTLIELLLTMAIISVLAGAVLIGLGGQRKKANQTRMLGEFSSIIQPILMCRSDGGNINLVAANGNGGTPAFCSLSNEYGTWPSVAGTDFSTTSGGSGYQRDNDFNDGSWYFYVDDGTVRVCCNSTSSKCHSLSTGGTCNTTTPAF